jgi:hypothetical protein
MFVWRAKRIRVPIGKSNGSQSFLRSQYFLSQRIPRPCMEQEGPLLFSEAPSVGSYSKLLHRSFCESA